MNDKALGQSTNDPISFLLKERKGKSLSHVRLFVTPWTITPQAPLSMEFSRKEYWSGLPFPSPDLPDPGIEPRSPALHADSLPSEPPGKTPAEGMEKREPSYTVDGNVHWCRHCRK